MRNWINRFMSGRYGADQLGRTLSVITLVFALAAIIGSKTWLRFLWWPALILLIWQYFRMLSRNLYRRQAENQWYLEKTDGIRRKISLCRDRFRQRKDYKFFSCPKCKTTVRVPRNKGTITITCPCCKDKFTRKS